MVVEKAAHFHSRQVSLFAQEENLKPQLLPAMFGLVWYMCKWSSRYLYNSRLWQLGWLVRLVLVVNEVDGREDTALWLATLVN